MVRLEGPHISIINEEFVSLSNTYNNAFFEAQRSGSYDSAIEIMRYVCALVNPQSIIDVGCGAGGWLRASQIFAENVKIFGVDGASGNTELFIDPSQFQEVDFEEDFIIPKKVDLAISLEVAEHLSPSRATYFVDQLVKTSPVVLFSAAIPNQGGVNHLNEQWQSYWMELFEKRGFVAHDCIRPLVMRNESVKWWYAQNTFLYVSRSYIPILGDVPNRVHSSDPFVDIVHPSLWKSRGMHR